MWENLASQISLKCNSQGMFFNTEETNYLKKVKGVGVILAGEGKTIQGLIFYSICKVTMTELMKELSISTTLDSRNEIALQQDKQMRYTRKICY